MRRLLHALLVVALAAAAVALAAVLVPRAIGYGTLAVTSDAAADAVPTGSLVLGSWHGEEAIRAGDVILVRREVAGDDPEPALHRVASLERSEGDVVVRLAGEPDAYALPDRVLRKERAVPYLGYLVAFLRTPLGWLLLVGVPATLMTLSVLRDGRGRRAPATPVAVPPEPASEPTPSEPQPDEDDVGGLADRESDLDRRAALFAVDEAGLRARERELAEREAAQSEAEASLAGALAAVVEERRRLAAEGDAVERRANAVLEAELAVARERREREPAAPSAHVVFVPGPQCYALLERGGAPPSLDAVVEHEGAAYVVSRVGRSPLPADPRPCAYLQRR